MRFFRDNLLAQFSILSLIIIVVIAVSSITILTIRLDGDLELLNEHGTAMMAGTMISPADPFSIPSLEADIERLKWLIIGILAGGFVVLYIALVNIVRNGWLTINRQRSELVSEIQERSELEAARRAIEVNALAQSKLATLGEMATGIAHEINQPLTYIDTTIQSMQEDIELDDLDQQRAHQALADSHRQIERISSIIDHLRVFGRADDTKTEVIRIDAVIENTLLLIRERIRLGDIALDIQVDENLVAIQGNANQLEQVFLNLLQNANDAFLDDQRSAKKIALAIRSAPDQSTVQVNLSDNGAGIASKHIDKIFDPSFTTKEVGRGTGLGLSIAYGIVRDHGGTITCESELNKGTTFLITLPALGARYAQA